MKNKRKEEDIKNFDLMASEWNKNIPKRSIEIADLLVRRLNITDEHSVLDVAAGTGILLSRFKKNGIKLKRYVAVDISNNMLKELKANFPTAEVINADFEREMRIDNRFDFVIIYNSIPHFKNMDMIFSNAYNNLNAKGKLVIVHARTRNELKEHHKNLGYVSNGDSIPSDGILNELSNKYLFRNVSIIDEQYFSYIGEK